MEMRMCEVCILEGRVVLRNWLTRLLRIENPNFEGGLVN
jgi:hypothetical protein